MSDYELIMQIFNEEKLKENIKKDKEYLGYVKERKNRKLDPPKLYRRYKRR